MDEPNQPESPLKNFRKVQVNTNTASVIDVCVELQFLTDNLSLQSTFRHSQRRKLLCNADLFWVTGINFQFSKRFFHNFFSTKFAVTLVFRRY